MPNIVKQKITCLSIIQETFLTSTSLHRNNNREQIVTVIQLVLIGAFQKCFGGFKNVCVSFIDTVISVNNSWKRTWHISKFKFSQEGSGNFTYFFEGQISVATGLWFSMWEIWFRMLFFLKFLVWLVPQGLLRFWRHRKTACFYYEIPEKKWAHCTSDHTL